MIRKKNLKNLVHITRHKRSLFIYRQRYIKVISTTSPYIGVNYSLMVENKEILKGMAKMPSVPVESDGYPSYHGSSGDWNYLGFCLVFASFLPESIKIHEHI